MKIEDALYIEMEAVHGIYTITMTVQTCYVRHIYDATSLDLTMPHRWEIYRMGLHYP
jgi:hypothetical protein